MKRPPVFKPAKVEGAKVFNGKCFIDKLYKGEWADYSKLFLEHNQRCYSCGQRSEATDHIRVHLGDFDLFYKKENHIPLCHKCHNTITGKFDRKMPQDLEGKMKWLNRNRQINSLNFAVKIVPFVFQTYLQHLQNRVSNK